MEDVTDFEIGTDHPLTLRRIYAGDAASPRRVLERSGLGYGWRYDFDVRAVFESGKLLISMPDGRKIGFRKSSDGTGYVPGSWGANGWFDYDYPRQETVVDSGNDVALTDVDGSVYVIYNLDPIPTNANKVSDFRGYTKSVKRPDGYTIAVGLAQSTGVTSVQYIQDSLGRRIDFQYSTNYVGRLVAASVGGTIVANYDYKNVTSSADKEEFLTIFPNGIPAGILESDAVLAKVSYTETPARSIQYVYENTAIPTALTGIIDERNVRYATFSYDASGYPTQTTHAGNVGKVTIAYERANNRVRVTNALGKIKYINYSTTSDGGYRQNTVTGVASTNCPASNSSFTYDTNNFVKSVVDEEGRTTTFVRNSVGLPTTITRGAGTTAAETQTITWNTTLRRPTTVTVAGQTKTTYTWTSGRLTKVQQTDLTAAADPARTWTMTYTSGGQLASVDGPLAGTDDTTLYGWNTSGFLASVTDELGHVTQITAWNLRGQPTRVVDPNGTVVTYDYDGAGRLTKVSQDTAGTPLVWSIAYDLSGDVTRITDPTGAYLAYGYDGARRLSKITNAKGETVTLGKNLLDLVTSVTVKDASATPQTTYSDTRSYDELGRLIKLVSGTNFTSRQSWDLSGLLETQTDARGGVVTTAYDAVTRLASRTAEDGGVESLTYDGDGDVAAYEDPKGLDTTYVRNGFGDVVQETSPDRGTTTYEYDTRGLKTRRTDASGTVTQWSYDAAGRPATITFPAATGYNVTFTWDATAGGNEGIGRLTGMTDGAGSSSWTYDAKGRVTKEVRKIGAYSYTTLYAFDTEGQLAQVTYPSGRVVNYTYDAMGLPSGVTTKRTSTSAVQTVSNWATYEPFGPLNGIGFGNGLVWYEYFDLGGFPDSIGLSNPDGTGVLFQRYHPNDGVNITGLNDALDDTQDVWMDGADGYDAANRLTKAGLTEGSVFKTHRYTYDKVGNRLTESTTPAGGSTTTETYAYTAGTNRLATVKTGATTLRSFAYDAEGSVTSDTRAGLVYTYTYDPLNRLRMTRQDGTQVGVNVYDGASRLSTRTITNLDTANGTVHYVHLLGGGGDLDALMPGMGVVMGGLGNRVLAEIDGATGVTSREYIWLGDRVIAVAPTGAAAGTLYWVTTDHLARPVQMTSGSKAVVWRVKYGPFGELIEKTGSAGLNARFPGQWFQLENGLSWNWHRHYDASLGRYVQPDPLGLVDGPSVYGYVRQNPMGGVDPEGLIVLPPDPEGLPPDWVPDPNHKDPNGTRWRNPEGGCLEFNQGRPGLSGWKGQDHWHDCTDKKRRDRHWKPGEDCPQPGDQVSDGLNQDPFIRNDNIDPRIPWWIFLIIFGGSLAPGY
ncbi:putative deoxyribonuclease RhsA [Pleomorphomonas sp. SM30]|uniref:RHS repeat-associated protein n=1 Tax=Oharaeibacter diazotrophicus TaxID=1920512 RepID=A0A4R6RD07_9HYPH|nr:RHS repeat-associated protein [Oharaeibacter diazotrophicus]BBE72967.1 putative deoxyribonuclease RhsA [Pleomorphomonas sp. SM30]